MIKGHGSSTAVSIENCIDQVYRTASNGMNEKIEAALAQKTGE